jgi:hypothetical protein
MANAGCALRCICREDVITLFIISAVAHGRGVLYVTQCCKRFVGEELKLEVLAAVERTVNVDLSAVASSESLVSKIILRTIVGVLFREDAGGGIA